MLCKLRFNNLSGTKRMLKKMRVILLATSISALLSSCLVEKKDVETISRTTDTLRIYQAGDYIEYDVIAVTSLPTGNTTKYGSLRIQWDGTADITDPISGLLISPDLKETTTLTYDGSTEPDAIATRYISQTNTDPADPNQGSIILQAIDDPLDADYWPYDPANTGNSGSPVISPVTFNSPMVIGVDSPLEFSVMECAASSCANEIYQFNDDTFNVVGDTREITTNLGVFSNPFEVSFSGGTFPVGTIALEFLGDIRDACGTSSDRITHNGNMFVMPEIGIIQMTNQCSNLTSGSIIFYTYTISNTSFTL